MDRVFSAHGLQKTEAHEGVCVDFECGMLARTKPLEQSRGGSFPPPAFSRSPGFGIALSFVKEHSRAQLYGIGVHHHQWVE